MSSARNSLHGRDMCVLVFVLCIQLLVFCKSVIFAACRMMKNFLAFIYKCDMFSFNSVDFLEKDEMKHMKCMFCLHGEV